MAARPTMRLFLLPISTRRSLIYCEPLSITNPPSASASANPNTPKPSYLDRAVTKANTTWADFEKDTKAAFNWKRRLTEYGNLLFRRIPFEEWGLKTIPAQPKPSTAPGAPPLPTPHVHVLFPSAYQRLTHSSLQATLRRIAHDRQPLHAKRMRWSIIAMPFTIPVGILPVIPNIPFIYLCFRAYSHWTALRGARHLAHLLDGGAVVPRPSATLDALYTQGLLSAGREATRGAAVPSARQTEELVQKLLRETRPHGVGSHVEGQIGGHENAELRAKGGHPSLGKKDDTNAEDNDVEEVLLLKGWNGKLIAEKLGLPGLEVEIERAVEQVEKGIKKAQEEKAQKQGQSAPNEGEKKG